MLPGSQLAISRYMAGEKYGEKINSTLDANVMITSHRGWFKYNLYFISNATLPSIFAKLVSILYSGEIGLQLI